MLEPLIVLTVLNCIFMFSSTVTTCALWWQHQKHRCCARAGAVKHQRSATKRPTRGIFGAIRRKPPDRTQLSGHVDVTCVADGSFKMRDKKSPKRSKRHLPYLSEYQRKREEKMLEREVDAKKRERKARMSEGSQTNDASSTVVMEFSTVQKVVQKIVDNPDSDVHPSRIAFKDMMTLQKDNPAKDNSATNNKKDSQEHNIEQRFVGNGKNFTITSNNNS